MGKRHQQNLTKQDTQIENKGMKKMPNIISHQENANQNPNEISLHTYQNSKNKKIVTTTNAAEDVKKLDHACIVDGNVKWYSYSGKELANFLEN